MSFNSLKCWKRLKLAVVVIFYQKKKILKVLNARFFMQYNFSESSLILKRLFYECICEKTWFGYK